ncbi:TonB-dependent receptor [Pseudomonas sp. NW5]|uniref:TonB-dependent receptor n=1 Tax=Pseudomonas sp. NW5 TaxID=2934934 RepID=UPI002021108F|nr:TonB-dependent receptor [Pseudomonas sp. NW5]MCL7462917.1 TonB-dependent receptor [Pseudomonas sp. NW5]
MSFRLQWLHLRSQALRTPITWLLASTVPSLYAAEPVQLESLTVTGSTISDRFAADSRVVSSTTVIEHEEISERHATNLIEVLRAVPGVTADLSGEGDSIKIKLRGIENQRYMGEKPGVAIVIDGVPVFERTGKVSVDLDNIQSIRVVKGGASYLFGEDALAGAVIITTKRGAGHEGVAIEHDRGSFGYQRDSLRGGFASEHLAGHLQWVSRRSDGYYELSERDTTSLSGNLQYFLDDVSDLTFGFEVSERFRDREGSVSGATMAKYDPRGVSEGRGYTRQFDVELSRYNLTYSRDFSATGTLQLLGYQYTDDTRYWSAPIRYDAQGRPVSDNQVDQYQNDNDYAQVQQGLKFEIRETFGRLGLMGGAEVRRNTFDEQATAKESYATTIRPRLIVVEQGTLKSDYLTEERTRALYSEAQLSLDKGLTLVANYRFDSTDLDGLDRLAGGLHTGDRYQNHSWRLGFNKALSADLSLYGAVSTGFRNPTVSQYADNPDLDPETAYTYEIGLHQDSQWLGWPTRLNASLFYIDRRDFITSNVGQYVNDKAASAAADIEEPRPENIGGVTSRGFELALSTEVRHRLSFDLAYTFLQSRFKDYDNYFLALGNPYGALVSDPAQFSNPASQVLFLRYDNSGNSVPRTPRHLLNLRVNWFPVEHWKLSGEMDYRGTSYADELNQETLPSRTLFNLALSHQRRFMAPGDIPLQFTAFLKVDNLLDERFYSSARGFYDSDANGVYNREDLSIVVDPGRVWQAGVALRF